MSENKIEGLASKLHTWYLEACLKLKPESYNPNAIKVYDALTEEQKFISQWIASNVHNREVQREIDIYINIFPKLKEKSKDYVRRQIAKLKKELK